MTASTLGLTDSKQFLQSGSSGGGNPASFGKLVSQAAASATTDLLNVLNSIKGFGQNQGKPSGATSDLTSDKTKQGVGHVQTDDTLKNALKNILKPHD
ncbi:hypothetical protein [Mesorhizobium sp.]|uniref:hypothetical protein n=1 Tax=Mesorhizobium sp. TaxID=1871066 RepID=UPI000FE3837D|nr:hypothetical protein [Mesorhizobium sp.]RWL34834.1 MAG: hypothetical protein EOR59_24045 [Mesorhizobium sp.]